MTVSRDELRDKGWVLPAPDQIGYVVRDLALVIALPERREVPLDRFGRDPDKAHGSASVLVPCEVRIRS